jgi:hypothetical protein
MRVPQDVLGKDLFGVCAEGGGYGAAGKPEMGEIGMVREDADPKFWWEGWTDGVALGGHKAVIASGGHGGWEACDLSEENGRVLRFVVGPV